MRLRRIQWIRSLGICPACGREMEGQRTVEGYKKALTFQHTVINRKERNWCCLVAGGDGLALSTHAHTHSVLIFCCPVRPLPLSSPVMNQGSSHLCLPHLFTNTTTLQMIQNSKNLWRIPEDHWGSENQVQKAVSLKNGRNLIHAGKLSAQTLQDHFTRGSRLSRGCCWLLAKLPMFLSPWKHFPGVKSLPEAAKGFGLLWVTVENITGENIGVLRRFLEIILPHFQLRFPNNFFLLRGNHETQSVNRHYGFFDECVRRYSPKVYDAFNDTFNCMPLCALVGERILCMHGGMSPDMKDLSSLANLKRFAAFLRIQIIPFFQADSVWQYPGRPGDGFDLGRPSRRPCRLGEERPRSQLRLWKGRAHRIFEQ